MLSHLSAPCSCQRIPIVLSRSVCSRIVLSLYPVVISHQYRFRWLSVPRRICTLYYLAFLLRIRTKLSSLRLVVPLSSSHRSRPGSARLFASSYLALPHRHFASASLSRLSIWQHSRYSVISLLSVHRVIQSHVIPSSFAFVLHRFHRRLYRIFASSRSRQPSCRYLEVI